jgi:pyrroline-5-carboxylate reductase
MTPSLSFLGAGRMARALIRGLLQAPFIEKEKIFVYYMSSSSSDTSNASNTQETKFSSTLKSIVIQNLCSKST